MFCLMSQTQAVVIHSPEQGPHDTSVEKNKACIMYATDVYMRGFLDICVAPLTYFRCHKRFQKVPEPLDLGTPFVDEIRKSSYILIFIA